MRRYSRTRETASLLRAAMLGYRAVGNHEAAARLHYVLYAPLREFANRRTRDPAGRFTRVAGGWYRSAR